VSPWITASAFTAKMTFMKVEQLEGDMGEFTDGLLARCKRLARYADKERSARVASERR
jgi:hypothetical protein